MDALRHADASSLKRFFGNDLNLVCRAIADNSSRFPQESELALKHLGVDVLQNNADYSVVIRQALTDILSTDQSAKNLF